MSIACVTNIVGDITLIDGFKMGAAGAAIATVAAQAVSVVLSLILIKKKGLPFHFAKKHLAFHKKTATNTAKTQQVAICFVSYRGLPFVCNNLLQESLFARKMTSFVSSIQRIEESCERQATPPIG